MASNPLKLIRTVAKALVSNDPDPQMTRQLVYAMSDAHGVRDELAMRVIELGDGRSVGEIIAIIYGQELGAGAWAGDIGIWSDIFAQRVVRVIDDLADTGYIRLRDAS